MSDLFDVRCCPVRFWAEREQKTSFRDCLALFRGVELSTGGECEPLWRLLLPQAALHRPARQA